MWMLPTAMVEALDSNWCCDGRATFMVTQLRLYVTTKNIVATEVGSQYEARK